MLALAQHTRCTIATSCLLFCLALWSADYVLAQTLPEPAACLTEEQGEPLGQSGIAFQDTVRNKIIRADVHERGAIKLVYATLIGASRRWRRVSINDHEFAKLSTLRNTLCPKADQPESLSFRLATWLLAFAYSLGHHRNFA